MRVLLDTHAFLWYVWGTPELSAPAAASIDDSNNEKFLSIASLWELAIKVSIGKLVLNRPFKDLKAELIDANGFEILPLDYQHTVTVSALPFHHKDPFDRILAAQSLEEDMPILSADVRLDAYGVKRLW